MKNTINQLTIENGQWTIKEEILSEFLENIYLNEIKVSNSKKYLTIDKVNKRWI